MKRPSSKSKPTPEPARKAIRTQADLARHLGIATETVSRALNDHPKVSQRLRDRVREAAEKLNYRPNAAALSMKTRQFRQVGVILPDNTHRPKQKFRQHMGELLAGINLALETADFSAVIAHVGSIDANRSSFGRILRHNLLDATLVLGNLPTGILQKVEQLTDCTIIVESNRFEATNCIRRDERSAGRLAATKAIEAGYDRFVWFQSSKTPDNVRHFSEQHRVDGVMEVAAENGVMVGRSGPVGWEWDPAEEQAFFDTLTP
ncbi:MAG: LacI family DNA-binding transcriptional regulator, partial [Planctomycetota bacterium]